MRRPLILIALCAGCALGACTDAGLQPTPPPVVAPVDDLLRIHGELCTEPADVTPFPVKILFAIDQSASLQCTDSRNRRFAALNRVVATLSPLPNVSFGFIGFASWSRKQGFTQNRDEIRPFLDPGQGLGPATDYQGALASAVQLLEADMVEAGPSLRARTKYLVVFMSDGVPEPRCHAGCEDDRERCGDGADNDGDGLSDGADPDCSDLDDNSLRPDNLYGVCNTDEAIPEDTYVDMAGRCPEYNQPRQILQRIDDLRALELAYSAGEVVLHTVLLSSPQAVVEGVCPGAQAAFGYNTDQARELLRGMARAGGGTFRDVDLEASDDAFLDFDFTALTSPFFVTEFVAYNGNAVPTATGPAIDSDGDGLGDDDEVARGLDPDARDSDGDGYSDLFEVRFARRGFDPLDPTSPALPCPAREDVDGDGLSDCEEGFLGTARRAADTDGDRMVDGLELRVGADPLVADANEDFDFDGVVNREEVRAGTVLRVDDAARARRNPVRYRLEDEGEKPVIDRETGAPVVRHCYAFDVRDVELVATRQPRDRGRNRVYLQIHGEPVGISGSPPVVRQACIEARLTGPGKKLPESGEVDVGPAAWAAFRSQSERGFLGLAECLGLDSLDLVRPDLEGIIEQCLPPRQQVGRVLLDRAELVDLLRRYYRRDLTTVLPREPSDLFVPIEIFKDENHCYRPWEVDRVLATLDVLAEACAACAAGRDAGAGDAGAADAGPGAGADGG